MKAVIFAAGNAMRTYPLTVSTPKALIPVLNKPLIHHILEQLREIVSEVIMIVGFEQEQIRQSCGDKFGDIVLTYIEQKELNGTGGALVLAKDHLQGKFIVLNGDDYISTEELQRCCAHQYAVLAKEVQDPERFGIFQLNENGTAKAIIEKPKEYVGNLANTGVYVLDTTIFDHELSLSSRGEYEITDAVTAFAQNHDIHVEKASSWFPITYPWNILEVNVRELRTKAQDGFGIDQNDSVVIEDFVTINGFVHIGSNTIIKAGSVIEGPVWIGSECVIGPNAHIRSDTIIGNNVRIGKTETVDTLWMDDTTAKHFGYVGHSVVGKNVNIGAGTVTADYRHDGKNNMTVVKGKKVNSLRRKLGSFFGDGVNTGIGTLIYPGRKIWPGLSTLPGEVVMKDKES